METLKDVATHFAFGKNWASYAGLIDASKIAEAKKGLLRLIPADDLRGRSFLDIGCGSGLHALAAAELGVGRVMAIDIDPDSVATARTLLSANKISIPWAAETMSVFDLDAGRQGRFEIVYSWGVLHHTGSMWEAVRKASSMVAPNGLLVFALYRATPMDPFWKLEKRLYAHAPRLVQAAIRAAYIAGYRLAIVARGRRFSRQGATDKSSRGMDFYHDIHDWLGGYPYETAAPAAVSAALAKLGFRTERVFTRPAGIGLFGSGCDEYVYRLER